MRKFLSTMVVIAVAVSAANTASAVSLSNFSKVDGSLDISDVANVYHNLVPESAFGQSGNAATGAVFANGTITAATGSRVAVILSCTGLHDTLDSTAGHKNDLCKVSSDIGAPAIVLSLKSTSSGDAVMSTTDGYLQGVAGKNVLAYQVYAQAPTNGLAGLYSITTEASTFLP